MRLARYFPAAMVGLAGFAGQAMMPQPCCAWDSVPESVLAESSDLQDTTYISDNAVITDSAVQPAGFYDSRPRHNTASQLQTETESSNADRPGLFYRGQKLRLPTLPFGRQTSSNDASQRMPQTSGAANTPYGMPRAQARLSLQGQQVSRPTQQPMPYGTPTHAASNANYQTARVADGQPPQPIRQDALPHVASRPTARAAYPVNRGQTIPNSSPISPWQTTPPVAPNAKPATSSAMPPAGPLSAADRLVAEAHELSNHAQNEWDYTRIIETCRRAQASQASPAAAQYANRLIGWALNRRGQLKAEAAQDKEAILDFNEAVRADASCWRAIHNRGVLLAQSGEFEKAFDDFSHTIKLNPQFAKAYSNRAALFMVANNLSAALNDYNRAIGLDPNIAVSHRGCGRVCQLLGKTDDAMAHYDAAVQLAPTDAYAAACRADLLTDIGRYSEAAAEYNRAIELDPKSTQAQSGSAWLLATCPDSSVRNPDLAIQRAQTVIELGGENDAMSFDTLAAAQANAGDFEAAMNSARKAIELAPVQDRDAYKERLVMYQQAKPYRIAPIDRMTQQVSYQTSSRDERVEK